MKNKINWRKLHSRIPNNFKMGKKTVKVQWVDKFLDKKQVGETDHNNLLIQLKTKESHIDTVHTYIHECIHIFSDEFNIKISEKQVQGLEKTLKIWLESGNIFK